jgi:peptidoglycan hydrolase-like protein with peptidoglycan-binding domain
MAASRPCGVLAGAMRYSPPRPRAQTSPRATGRLGVFSTISTLAIAIALAIQPASVAAQPPVSASWHGRAIQQPQRPDDGIATTVVSLPAGWSAGPVRTGTGFAQQGGSQRVREVQRRLWRLGYSPGPVDGLFGAQTRAAVQWFQVKHGLTPDGIAGPQTLSLLRERTVGAPAPTPARDDRPSGRGAVPQWPPAAAPTEQAGRRGDGGTPEWLVALVLLLLAAPVALAVTSLRRGRRETPKQRRPGPADREVAAGPAPQAHPTASAAPTNGAATAPAAATPPRPDPVPATAERTLAIGYVRSTRDRAELARHAGAIRRACARRDWTLEELVHDERGGPTFERPGLAAALERLSGPGPSRLVVSKLAHLSSSAADITALFEWFAEHDVQMVATDVGLDTTTPEGRRAAESRLAAVEQRQAGTRKNGRKRGHGEARRKLAAAVGRAGPNDNGVRG